MGASAGVKGVGVSRKASAVNLLSCTATCISHHNYAIVNTRDDDKSIVIHFVPEVENSNVRASVQIQHRGSTLRRRTYAMQIR
jgi:hypothetical protein